MAASSMYDVEREYHAVEMAEVFSTNVHGEVNSAQEQPDDFPPEEALDRDHFRRILNAFRNYSDHALKRVTRAEDFLQTMPELHQRLLRNYQQSLQNIRSAVAHNQTIIDLLIKDAAQMFENADHSLDVDCNAEVPPSNLDMDKVQSTLKQFVRDWSNEGANERKLCYDRILKEIEERFPENRGQIQILVPGAGLGRLTYEIASRGYACQGNEFSLFMLLASNFVLNRCPGVNLYKIYPWIHQFCNNVKSEDQMQCVSFPDINPSQLQADAQFSMAAGDFLDVYTEPDAWHCIATCFFIDTASNIVRYIETIYNILKPGGYWINLGPLLYHFADIPSENSIEPSFEDVLDIILKMGFVVLKEQINVPTTYSQNPNSMLQFDYRSVFFVCQKKSILRLPSSSNASDECNSR